MDLTTLARVKARLGKTSVADTADDVNLAATIAGVSRAVEQYLCRETEAVERTEYFDIRDGQSLFELKGWPITEIDSVHLDVDNAFPADTLVDSALYTYDAELGNLRFKARMVGFAPRALKVVYTGGMGADAAALVAGDYADVVHAVERQVMHEWKKIGREAIQSVTHEGGTVSYVEDGLLRGVRDVLDRHRRLSLG